MTKPVPTPRVGVTWPTTSSVPASLSTCTTDGVSSFTTCGASRPPPSPGSPSASAVGDSVVEPGAEGVAAVVGSPEPPSQAPRTRARTNTDRTTRTARATEILLSPSVSTLGCISQLLPCRMGSTSSAVEQQDKSGPTHVNVSSSDPDYRPLGGEGLLRP